MNGDDTAGGRPELDRERELEWLLAAALREGTEGTGGEGGESAVTGTGIGEREAVAAFLVARDSGAHKLARTRRRDDWR